jgi:hypothetical protein
MILSNVAIVDAMQSRKIKIEPALPLFNTTSIKNILELYPRVNLLLHFKNMSSRKISYKLYP